MAPTIPRLATYESGGPIKLLNPTFFLLDDSSVGASDFSAMAQCTFLHGRRWWRLFMCMCVLVCRVRFSQVQGISRARTDWSSPRRRVPRGGRPSASAGQAEPACGLGRGGRAGAQRAGCRGCAERERERGAPRGTKPDAAGGEVQLNDVEPDEHGHHGAPCDVQPGAGWLDNLARGRRCQRV